MNHGDTEFTESARSEQKRPAEKARPGKDRQRCGVRQPVGVRRLDAAVLADRHLPEALSDGSPKEI